MSLKAATAKMPRIMEVLPPPIRSIIRNPAIIANSDIKSGILCRVSIFARLVDIVSSPALKDLSITPKELFDFR